MQTQEPRLLLKTFVHGYVTKDGKAVAPHADLRPQRAKPEEGGGGMPRQGGGEPEAHSESTPPKAKHYAAPEGGRKYTVGEKVRVKGREGIFVVTAIEGQSVSVKGEDGSTATLRLGAPMAKSEGPVLLLKATGADPKRQGDKGRAPGAAAGGKPAGGSAKSKPIREAQPVASRGAPDGEPEMEHQGRVAFQHGKVKGEGVIVASGPDGVLVQDDTGREHPVRHDNLIGEVEGGEGADGAEAAEGGEDAAGEVAAMLKDADPGMLKKMLQALKTLAPMFGSKAGAAAKPAAKPKAPAK